MEAITQKNILEHIARQYRAALKMLEQAVASCPESLWLDQEYPNRFWHISYHALFYTHLYLQASESDFQPWEKHRKNYQYLGALPSSPHERPIIDTPYSKEEILEFVQFCLKEIESKVGSVDLEAASGFPWLPFNKLELQFYNIRHLQHHAGQLIDRLRTRENVAVAWARSV